MRFGEKSHKRRHKKRKKIGKTRREERKAPKELTPLYVGGVLISWVRGGRQGGGGFGFVFCSVFFFIYALPVVNSAAYGASYVSWFTWFDCFQLCRN